ncbi:MAG: hypothetical protein MJB14_06340, partial [Spirochaetes bacterium]|nr:hypothetical protein [Spirochaetota bacterium]
IKDGGMKYLLQLFKEKKAGIDDPTYRMMAIILAFFTFIYINIPRIDFFICIMVFLTFFISAFYFEDMKLLKKLSFITLIAHVVFFILIISNVFKNLRADDLTYYIPDIIYLTYLILFIIYVFFQIKAKKENIRKFITILLVALIVPLILCPIFRFSFLIPLPKEGMIIDIMHEIKYIISGALKG